MLLKCIFFEIPTNPKLQKSNILFASKCETHKWEENGFWTRILYFSFLKPCISLLTITDADGGKEALQLINVCSSWIVECRMTWEEKHIQAHNKFNDWNLGIGNAFTLQKCSGLNLSWNTWLIFHSQINDVLVGPKTHIFFIWSLFSMCQRYLVNKNIISILSNDPVWQNLRRQQKGILRLCVWTSNTFT